MSYKEVKEPDKILSDEEAVKYGRYTKAQLEDIIGKMRQWSERLYWVSTHIGFHAFIEWNGLIAKFIDLCSLAMNQGIDFTNTNIHTGKALKIEKHNIDYLVEKFTCIFGMSFNNETLGYFFSEMEKRTGLRANGYERTETESVTEKRNS